MPGHELGHAVLDLEPGVDLEEVEGPVGVPQELGGRRVPETAGRRHPDRQVVQVTPLGRRQPGRRRLLDELLVASLERAVALPDRDDRARRVAEQLDLDVTRRTDLALQVDRTVAERRRRLGRSGGQRGGQLGGLATRRIPRPPPPAAALTSNGKPIRSASAMIASRPSGRSTATGSRVPGTASTPTDRAISRARSLSPSASMTADGGPTKTSPASSTARANAARSDRNPYPGWIASAPVGERRLDDRVDPEVALGRRRRTDPDRDVGQPDVHGAGIGVAVDGDRLHAQLVAGPDDPDGDLAPVGDQDATEWRRRPGHRRVASLRKDMASRPASERDVAMLLSRVRVALVGQHLERPDEPQARLGRPDDVVDVAAGRRDVRVRERRP